MGDYCLVCREVAGKIEIPGGLLWEDDNAVAFHLPPLDDNPRPYLGHCMVVTRRYIDHVCDDERGHLADLPSRALRDAAARKPRDARARPPLLRGRRQRLLLEQGREASAALERTQVCDGLGSDRRRSLRAPCRRRNRLPAFVVRGPWM